MALTLTIDSADIASGVTSDKSSIDLEFHLSDTVSNFTSADVDVTNGTIASFAGSGSEYTATLTPTAVGEVSVAITANSFTNSDSEQNEPASFSYTYKLPTVELSVTDHAGDDVLGRQTYGAYTATFTFSEPPLSFAGADISVTGGAFSGLTGSGKTRTGTVTAAADHYDAMKVDLSTAGKSKATPIAAVDWTNILPTMTMKREVLEGGVNKYRYFAGSTEQVGDTETIFIPTTATPYMILIDNKHEDVANNQSTLVIQNSFSLTNDIKFNRGIFQNVDTSFNVANNARFVRIVNQPSNAVRIKSTTGKPTRYQWELHIVDPS